MTFGVNELLALRDSYLKFVSGNAVTLSSMTLLGPLSALWVSHGHWRPDGPARVRHVLREALSAFARANRAVDEAKTLVENEARRRAIEANESPPPRAIRLPLDWQDMVFVVRMTWGIDAYPVTGAEAIRRFGRLREEVPQQALRQIDVTAWAQQILSHRAVISWVTPLVPPGETVAPDSSRTGWVDLNYANWPLQGEGQVHERRDFVNAVRATLVAKAPALPAFSDRDLITLARATAAPLLRAYFTDPVQRDARLRIEHAAETWRHLDNAVNEGPRDTSRYRTYRSGGSGYQRKAALAAELFFWSIAQGWEGDGIVDQAKHRLYDIPLLDKLVKHQVDDGLSEKALADRFAVTPRATLSVAPAEAGQHLSVRRLDAPFGPDEAIELADKVRRASGQLRVMLGRRYVEARAAYELTSPPPPPSLKLFLADVSVELDLTYSHHEPLVHELRKVKRQAEERGRGGAYMFFQLRNDALLDMNLRNDYPAAFTKFIDGIQLLQIRESAIESKEYLETIQQYWLALAGLCTRVIESHLRRQRKRQHVNEIERYVVFAIKSAGEAKSNLAKLDAHLLADRHIDDHISSKSWRVHTQLIRLRTLLAVHTVVESGLVSHPSTQTGGPASLQALAEAYSTVVTTPELSTANRVYVMQLAIWHAFVRGGDLPAVRDLSPALALGSDKDALPILLTVDPDEMDSHGMTTIRFDIVRASDWVTSRDQIACTLATIPPDGPVAELVSDRWGSAFVDWRDRFDPAKLEAKSTPQKKGSHRTTRDPKER